MKNGIHPKYVESTITCACGEVFQTRSTKKEIKVGVCSKCHPFFTGTQKFVDTAGRVEKFMKKYAKAEQEKKRIRKAKKADREAAENIARQEEKEPETVEVQPAAESDVQSNRPAEAPTGREAEKQPGTEAEAEATGGATEPNTPTGS